MCGLWNHLTNVYKSVVTEIYHLVYYIQMVMTPWPVTLRKMSKLKAETVSNDDPLPVPDREPPDGPYQ